MNPIKQITEPRPPFPLFPPVQTTENPPTPHRPPFTLYILLTLLVFTLSASAQTEIETRIQLDTINEQISELRQANARSPQARRIREDMQTATEDYEQAVSAIPGIQEIDEEIENLRRQIADCRKRRINLIKASESSLGTIRERADDTAIALREAITGGEQGRTLQAEQRRLIQELSETSQSILPATAANQGQNANQNRQ